MEENNNQTPQNPQSLASQGLALEPNSNPQTPTKLSNQAHCNRCHSEISQSFYFCPQCGHKIKEPPYHFSAVSTFSILLLSFLFPPFGLIPGFKYLKNENKKAKLVGVLTIIVTIISFIIFILILQEYLNQLNRTINNINNINSYY